MQLLANSLFGGLVSV